MPCPDCDKLYVELEALKAELAAARARFEGQKQRILDQVDRVIDDFEYKQQALVALADRHMHDSLARLARLEAMMRKGAGLAPP